MSDHISSTRDWEAEEDARALMRAHEIQEDSKRLTKAKKALTKIEKEAAETQLSAKVAGKLKSAHKRK